MGFFNAFNGLPIARWSDAGVLNKKLSCLFPIEKWGRRGPWIVLGIPTLIIGVFLMWIPPSSISGAGLAGWLAFVYFMIANGMTATLQSMLATVQELMPDGAAIASQTAYNRVFVFLGFLFAPVIVPAIAFKNTPDIQKNCCIQPLTDCQSPPSCVCYNTSVLGNISFMQEWSTACPDMRVTDHDISSQCVFSANKRVFTFVGILLVLIALTSCTVIIPSRKSQVRNNNPTFSLCTSIKEAFKNDAFRILTLVNLFSSLNTQLFSTFLPYFLLYNIGVPDTEVGYNVSVILAPIIICALLTLPLFSKLLQMRDNNNKLRFHPARVMTVTSVTRGLISFALSIWAIQKKSILILIITGSVIGLLSGGRQMFLEPEAKNLDND